MPLLARLRLRACSFMTVAIAAALVAACSTTNERSMTRPSKRSKEYFSEAAYGVRASPRVSNLRTRLPRGGGRDQLGSPYMVAGKWYYPREDRHYSKVGAASWYGDAFHGRLTANGEIYDMTHLTAAHPTMPLPSYARVTNLVNGASIIVRVNDRGPYAAGRIIDLSKHAAEMLDYANTGVAKVKVDYVGRAPLDGHDDAYLMASYRPGRDMGGNEGLPTGVMMAMNGPSPSRGALPGVRDAAGGAIAGDDQAAAEPAQVATAPGWLEPAAAPVAYSPQTDTTELPAFGPIFPDRPENDVWPAQPQQVAGLMSYAERPLGAASPFDMMVGNDDYVAAGTFADKAQADAIAAALDGMGRISVEPSQDETGTWYSVEIRSDGSHSVDDILQAVWNNGAPDALAVHD
jgi:rare lipoprotein A